MPNVVNYEHWYSKDSVDLARRLQGSIFKWNGKWVYCTEITNGHIFLVDSQRNENHYHLKNNWNCLEFPTETIGNMTTEPTRIDICSTRQYRWGIHSSTFQYSSLSTKRPAHARQSRPQSILKTLERQYKPYNSSEIKSLTPNLFHEEGLLQFKHTIIGYISQNKNPRLLKMYEKYPLIKAELEQIKWS